MEEDAPRQGSTGRGFLGGSSSSFPRGRIPVMEGKVELRVVDVSRRRMSNIPPWLVRRAANIVRENCGVLDLEELADLAMALMEEAEARFSTRGARVTR